MKDIDPANSGLGDLDALLNTRSVSDLSWLAVDAEEYNKSEALPKQNLDIIPELAKALTEGDERVPTLIPIRPHVMVNSNPLDIPSTPVRSATASVRNRVAQYVVSGMGSQQIAQRLQLEFSPEQIRSASGEVQDILENRGLLGNVFVDSSVLPNCHQDGDDKALVAAKARRALYVLAKDKCGDCVHNQGGRCASLKKRIVASVPYDQATLAHYATQLSGEGRLRMQDVPRNAEGRREVLRLSFLTTPVAHVSPDGVLKVHQQKQAAKPTVTGESVQDFVTRATAAPTVDSMPSAPYLKYARRMMEGHDDTAQLLEAADPDLRRLASERGLLGHTYVDVDAYGGCRSALAAVQASGVRPDFFLRRSASCGTCADKCDGACAALAQVAPVATRMPAIGKQHAEAALERAAARGAISPETVKIAAARLQDGDLRAIVARVNTMRSAPEPEVRQYAGPKGKLFTGTVSEQAPALDAEEVRRSVSHLMNTGLKGRHLQAAVLARYSQAALASVKQVGSALSSLDGVQGDYFVDPTAYSDYGRGCNEGSAAFRKRGAQNVMASGGCTGCVSQTHPGWCSKYAKTLIRSVPEDVKIAAKSRRNLQVIASVPVVDPSQEFGISADLEVGPRAVRSAAPEISVKAPGKLTD